MTSLEGKRFGRLSLIALLMLIGAASHSHAAALYTLTDLGVGGDIPDSFGSAGQVISNLGPGRAQDGLYYIQNKPGPEPAGAYRAFLGINGQTPTELPSNVLPGGGGVDFASAVNKTGTVVGYQDNSAGPGAAFVYTSGGLLQTVPLPYTTLVPTMSHSAAYSINDSGMIVGTTLGAGGPASGEMVAFLANGTASWDLNNLIAPGSGMQLSSATDINDAGQILVQAYDAQGREHNVLLTPIPSPEPTTWLILGSGAVVFVWRKGDSRGLLDC